MFAILLVGGTRMEYFVASIFSAVGLGWIGS